MEECKRCEQKENKNLKHGAKSRLNYHLNSIGCCFHRMDVPALCPTKRHRQHSLKSIAASGFKFVVVLPLLLRPLIWNPYVVVGRGAACCCNIEFLEAGSLIWSGRIASSFSRITSVISV